jgi:hypothetical protein
MACAYARLRSVNKVPGLDPLVSVGSSLRNVSYLPGPYPGHATAKPVSDVLTLFPSAMSWYRTRGGWEGGGLDDFGQDAELDGLG